MSPDDRERLVRIEVKLDTALSHMADVETRLRSVETFKVKALSTLAVVWAIIQAVGTVILERFRGE